MSTKKRHSSLRGPAGSSNSNDSIPIPKDEIFSAQQLLLAHSLGFARVDLRTVKLVPLPAQRQIDENHVALLAKDMSKHGIRNADSDRLRAIWFGFNGDPEDAPTPAPVTNSPEPLKNVKIGVFCGQHRIQAAIRVAQFSSLGDVTRPQFWSINLYKSALLDLMDTATFAAIVAGDNVERERKPQKYMTLPEIMNKAWEQDTYEQSKAFVLGLPDMPQNTKRSIQYLITDHNCFAAMKKIERAMPGLVSTMSASRGRELFGWHFGALWQHIASEVVCLGQTLGQPSITGSILVGHDAPQPPVIQGVPHTQGPNGSWCIKHQPNKHWMALGLTPRCTATGNLISAFEVLLSTGDPNAKGGKQARTNVRHLAEFVSARDQDGALFDSFVYACWMFTGSLLEKKSESVSIENLEEKLVTTPELLEALKCHPRQDVANIVIQRVETRLQGIAAKQAMQASLTAIPSVKPMQVAHPNGSDEEEPLGMILANDPEIQNPDRGHSFALSSKPFVGLKGTKQPTQHVITDAKPSSFVFDDSSQDLIILGDMTSHVPSGGENELAPEKNGDGSTDLSEDELARLLEVNEAQSPPEALIENSADDMDVDAIAIDAIRPVLDQEVGLASPVAGRFPSEPPWPVPTNDETKLYHAWIMQMHAVFAVCSPEQRMTVLRLVNAHSYDLKTRFVVGKNQLTPSRKRPRGFCDPPVPAIRPGKVLAPEEIATSIVMDDTQWGLVVSYLRSNRSLIVIGGGVSTYAGVQNFTADDSRGLMMSAFEVNEHGCQQKIWSCAKEVIQARSMQRGHLHTLLALLLYRGSTVVSTNFDGLEAIPNELIPSAYQANVELQVASAQAWASSRLHRLHGDITLVRCSGCSSRDVLTIDNIDTYITGSVAPCTKCASGQCQSFWFPDIRFIDTVACTNPREEHEPIAKKRKDSDRPPREHSMEHKRLLTTLKAKDDNTFDAIFIIGSALPNDTLYRDLSELSEGASKGCKTVYVVDVKCSLRVQAIRSHIFIQMDSETFAEQVCQRMLQ